MRPTRCGVDGKVLAWNTFRPELAPVLVPGLGNIVQVAAGLGYAAGLDASGQVWAWESGDETHFNVGQPGWVPPVKVTGLTEVVALAPLTALKADGTVWTWLNHALPPKPEAWRAWEAQRWWATLGPSGDGSVLDPPRASPPSSAMTSSISTPSVTSLATAGGHLPTTDALLMLRSDGTCGTAASTPTRGQQRHHAQFLHQRLATSS